MVCVTNGLSWDPIDVIRSRLEHNQNALIVFTGPTGSGKSLSALELARLIDPLFTENQVVFTVKDFRTMVKALGPRRVLIFDEAGVDLDSRRSQSKGNVNFSNLMKVFRYLQIPTIFTLPNLSMLDKNVRRMFHYWIKTTSIDYKEKICWTSLYNINASDDWNDLVTRSLPRVQDPVTHARRKITHVGFKLPPKKLAEAYEEMKNQYVHSMMDKQDAEFEEAEEKKFNSKSGRMMREFEVKSKLPPATFPFSPLIPKQSKTLSGPKILSREKDK